MAYWRLKLYKTPDKFCPQISGQECGKSVHRRCKIEVCGITAVNNNIKSMCSPVLTLNFIQVHVHGAISRSWSRVK